MQFSSLREPHSDALHGAIITSTVVHAWRSFSFLQCLAFQRPHSPFRAPSRPCWNTLHAPIPPCRDSPLLSTPLCSTGRPQPSSTAPLCQSWVLRGPTRSGLRRCASMTWRVRSRHHDAPCGGMGRDSSRYRGSYSRKTHLFCVRIYLTRSHCCFCFCCFYPS